MNKTERIQEQEQIQEYLSSNCVYNTLQSMLQQVIISKPQSPIDFMIEYLSRPQSKFLNNLEQIIFLIGPPSMNLYSKLQQALKQLGRGMDRVESFNCGQYIAKELQSKLTDKSKKAFSENQMIDSEQLNNAILPKLNEFKKSKSHIIIEGFPKTLNQAVRLQKEHIFHTKVIFVNVSPDQLAELCVKKVGEVNAHKNEDQKEYILDFMETQYRVNMHALKTFYKPNYLQLDATKLNSDQQIISELKRCLNLKVGISPPKKPHQIVIMGSPQSPRGTLGRLLSKRYGLVYISTAELIAEEIRRDTINGRKIKDSFLKKQLIDSFIVEILIDERIRKKDCQMQGYILQGYPKSLQQWKGLRNLKVRPTFYVAIGKRDEQLTEIKPNGNDINHMLLKWEDLRGELTKISQSIFWLDPSLNIDSMVQEVSFQIQRGA